MGTEKKMQVHEEKENPNIPFDLLTTEILTRLPPKSLFRFKTVCKQWLATISTPEFASLHVKRSKMITNHPNHNHGVLIATIANSSTSGNDNMSSVCGFLSYHYNAYKNHTLHITRNCYLFPYPPDVMYRVLGSCNGLVCLWLCSVETICFWNPVTRECRMIRMPLMDQEAVHLNQGLWGLGYIQASDDYTLVNIRLRFLGGTKGFVVSAYTLRTNNWNQYLCYSPLANVTQYPEVKPYHPIFGININNVIAHWLVPKRHANGSIKPSILAFDMVNESFNDVPLPQRLDDRDMWQYTPFCLSNIKDNICVIVKNQNHPRQARLVWELKCYGDWQSWKKIFNFNALFDGCPGKHASDLKNKGLNTAKKGFQFLMFLMNSEAWLVCHGDRQKQRCYQLQGFDSTRQVCSHVETFVSPFIGENLDHPTGDDSMIYE